MRKSILATAGKWAIAIATIIPALAFMLVLGGDMPYISTGQAIAVRCIAFVGFASCVGIGVYCAKHGLFPATDEEDGE